MGVLASNKLGYRPGITRTSVLWKKNKQQTTKSVVWKDVLLDVENICVSWFQEELAGGTQYSQHTSLL